MAWQLRPYQEEGIANLRALMAQGKRRIIRQLPTGGGKTVEIKTITEAAAGRGKRVCLMAHRQELLEQLSAAIDVPHGWIKANKPMASSHAVQVASVQTLARRKERYDFDLLIVDECFPAGTVVSGKPIEHIKIGDMVDSFDVEKMEFCKRKVTHVFNNTTRKIISIYFPKYGVLNCTENHPIYSNGKWIPAGDLKIGDTLLLKENENEKLCLCYLSERISKYKQGNDLFKGLFKCISQNERSALSNALSCMFSGCCALWKEKIGSKMPWSRVLFRRVFEKVSERKKFEGDGGNKSPLCLRENETKQPYDEGRYKKEDVRHIKEDWSQTHNSGWQWETYSNSTQNVGGCAGLGGGVSSFDSNHEVALLEVRHCKSRFIDWCRSGWKFSLLNKEENARCGKNSGFRIVRVEGIEVYEQGSSARFAELCPEGSVYNLEVEGTNTYFANGILVHNCHHSKASQYVSIIEHYSNAFVLGFTATPHRLDGRGFDDVFEDIVLGPSVSQLVAGGYLKPAIYYGPPEKIKLSGVKKTAGDYNNPQLASVMNESRITGNAIEHYAKHAAGIPAILFGVNRAHIQAAADMFNGAGFRFVAVDGTMDRKIIKRALQDLAARRIDGICSCELISEGVDIPAVSAGIMLRPTQSLSLWLQQLGRCLRPAEGFDTAIILDHAGNTLIHGFAHDEREWSLFGECDETGVKRKRKQREMETKFIQCDNCLLIHERAAECPACGHLHVDPSSVCGDGELVLLEGASARLSRLDIEMRKADWKDLYADMVRLGHKSGWAYYEFKKLYPNDVVINDHDRLIIPQVATLADKELVYTRLLTECKVKGYKPGRASFKFKEMFGTWPQGFTTRVKHEVGYGLEEMEEFQKNFRKVAQ